MTGLDTDIFPGHEDLLDIGLLQKVQDDFARIVGVNALVYDLQGKPITEPSNFCEYCRIIRSTEKGLRDCTASDVALWELAQNSQGAAVPCKYGRLMDGVAPILVGGRRIANWGIGGVRFKKYSPQIIEGVKSYAREIGVPEELLVEKYLETKLVGKTQFAEIIRFLITLSGEMSELAFANLRLRREMMQRIKADERYRSIIKNAIVGICEISNTGSFTYLNDQLAEMLGYDRNELVGKSIVELWSSDHNIESYFKGIVSFANQSFSTVGYDLKGYLRKKTGVLLPCRICLTPQKSLSDHIIKSSAVIIDTSAEEQALTTLAGRNRELVENQRQLDLYFNGAVNALCIYDGHLRRKKYNPSYRRIAIQCGFITNLDNGEMWEPLDRAEVSKVLSGVRTSHEVHYEFGMNLYSITVEPIADVEKSSRQLLVTMKDITDYHVMMEKMLFAQRMAGVGMLASGIAHDMKGVFGVLGNSNLVLEKLGSLGDAEEKRSKYAEIVRDQKEGIRFGRRLLNQMISLSGRSKETMEVFALRECVDAIIRIYGGIIQEKNAALTVAIRDGVQVHGIRIHLLHVLMNLLSNALEAIKDNGEITIREECDSRFFRLCVSDNGCGISEKDQKNIFQAFYSTKRDGTGLGLFSARNTISSLGGGISVASVPDEGCVFTIEIPDTERFQTILVKIP